MPWLKYLVGLSTQRRGFYPLSAEVGFVLDGVAVGHILSENCVFPVSIISPMLHTHCHLSLRLYNSR
jgi:hypothetical protein